MLARGVRSAVVRELALSTAGALLRDSARSLATVMGLTLEDLSAVLNALSAQFAGEHAEQQQIPCPQG